MQVLKNKIPPPLVAVMCGYLMWVISLLTPIVSVADWLRWILAFLLVCVGGYFSLAGVRSFAKAKTTVNPLRPEAATTLVTTGIYQVTRNPMYMGFVFFLLALLVLLASPVSLCAVFLFVAYMNAFQIKPEEAALKERFPQVYDEYLANVRRWL